MLHPSGPAKFFRCLLTLLALSLSACHSQPSQTPLVKLDSHHFQIHRVSTEPLEELTEPRIFIDSQETSFKNLSYIHHLRSFDPNTSASQFEDFHTFEVASEIELGDRVEVRADSVTLTGDIVRANPHPGIHVDRIGYQQGQPGVIKLGLYLGQRELPLPQGAAVKLIPVDGRAPQELSWVRTPERGYPYEPNPNQEVATVVLPDLPEGQYRVEVPEWGVSETFRVSPTAALESAQNYALGLYHQRCGVELKKPYTPWVRPACHLGPVSGSSTAISGGHHDAGDYGRYTHNSALASHALLYAAENWFPTSPPDNLGLPESGDGLSDLHQIALIELDFLIQMQRPDGLFWGRISPKERAYESDVTADRAGPQRVREGSSAATAAAVAVLFEASRSAYLHEHWPDRAKAFKHSAERGWQALEKVSFKKSDHHYGDVFEDRDERLWAALERSLAMAEKPPEFEGDSNSLRHWGWWPAYEGYGGAARAAASIEKKALGQTMVLSREVEAASLAWLEAHRASAYGVSFPIASKRHQSAGWFFPLDYSFDMIAPSPSQPSPEVLAAVCANWAYERGVNPLNQVFLTGYGELSPRYLLHQQAINDEFALAPAGLPVGSMVTNIRFANVPENVERPPLIPGPEGKPLDQRFSDSPNVLSESTVVNQARGLAVCAWLASRAKEPSRSRVSPAQREPR